MSSAGACHEWQDALYDIKDDTRDQILEQVPRWEEWQDDIYNFWDELIEYGWEAGERRETTVETQHGIIQVVARCEEVPYMLQDGILFSED